MIVSCTPFHVPPYPSVPAGATGRSVSRADAVADVDAMMKTFEDVHPDLYGTWPRDSAAAARRRLVAELPDSMTRLAWWTRLAPFVARFGDGHTNTWPPDDELTREWKAGALMCPLTVTLDDRLKLRVRVLFGDSALAPGERILSVNGHDADSLVAVWMHRVSGESDVYRSIMVADGFRDDLLIDAIGSPFHFRVQGADGTTRSVTVTGIFAGFTRQSRPPWACQARASVRRHST